MSVTRQLVDVCDYWPSCDQSHWDHRARDGRRSTRTDELSSAQQRILERAIEAEIIPRLMLAHSEQDFVITSNAVLDWSPSVQDVQEFVRLLLSHENFAARSYVDVIMARGARLDVVLLSLFAPSARLLGELWKDDFCNFADVTIALSRLQQMLRELSPNWRRDALAGPGSRRAFLTVAPGDQHTFGLFIVQEFFRKAGWYVCGGIYDTADELLSAAGSEPFDVVGLSVSCDASADGLGNLIAALRKSASNPAVNMMVGGRFFLEHPEFVACVGADATAPDGRRAVPQLSNLLDTTGVRY
jgi:methanogenic corrinoid protein MtbC1